MPLAPFGAQPPEGDTVINKNIIANFRRFTNHHAHAVIDEKPAPDFRGGMNFDSRQPAEKVGKNPRRKLKTVIIAMVEKLAFKLRSEEKLTSCIAVKIRYSNFDTVSKQKHIAYTSSDQELIKTALELFDRLYAKRLLIRLVGVRLSNLVHGNYQISLFEDTEESIRLYQAMDKMKSKYGSDALFRAATQNVNNRIRMDNNLFHG